MILELNKLKENLMLAKKENQLVKYSAKNLKSFGKIDSIKKAVESNTVSLTVLRKDNSEEAVIKYIILWISRLNEYLNISRKMNFDQMQQTAEHILQDYYYLKQSDLYFVFSQAEKGRYGEFYDCLDGAKILSWFEKYDIERANYVYDEGLEIFEKRKKEDIL